MSETVRFPSRDLQLAANFFAPDAKGGTKLPGIVVSHPFGGVKEQTAGTYARELAKNGFATLAFDASYQGDSEGVPRFLEDPYVRVEDIRAAVSYLQSRPDVDPDRIGVLGICASGGYAPFAAATDLRMKAVAAVSAMDAGATIRNGFDGKETSASRKNLDLALRAAAADRAAQAKGADPTYVSLLPNTVEDVPAELWNMIGEGVEYYRTPRGQHPNSQNKLTASSYAMMAAFDAYSLVDLISPRPLLMIAGSKAHSLGFSQDAMAKAREPKELFLIDGATHMALYDKPEYVAAAVEKLTSFFREHLA